MKQSISTICCILILSIAVQAGVSEPIAPSSINDWTALSSLQPGDDIAIRTKDGHTLKGTFKNASDSAIFMNQAAETVNLERTAVETVWRMKRTFKKPILIGAAIGAGSGAAIGAAVGGCNKGDFVCFERTGTIPAGAAILGIIGAVIGLIIGSAHRSRVLVYRAL